jgi:hypothetical protein
VIGEDGGVHRLDQGGTIASMRNADINAGLTRREMLQLSAAGVAGLGAKLAFPGLAAAAGATRVTTKQVMTAEERLYSDLLQKWCDGLVARQVTELADRALRGGCCARRAG